MLIPHFPAIAVDTESLDSPGSVLPARALENMLSEMRSFLPIPQGENARERYSHLALSVNCFLSTLYPPIAFRLLPGPGTSLMKGDCLMLEALDHISKEHYPEAVIRLRESLDCYVRYFVKLSIDEIERSRSVETNMSSIDGLLDELVKIVEMGTGSCSDAFLIKRQPISSGHWVPGDSGVFAWADEKQESVAEVIDLYTQSEVTTTSCFTANASMFYPSSLASLSLVCRCIDRNRLGRVVDLGCGNGLAAGVFSVFAEDVTGYEIDPFLCGECFGVVQRLPENLRRKVTIYNENFFNPQWSDADLFYIYWPFDRDRTPEMCRLFNEKLAREMDPGSLFFVSSELELDFQNLQPVGIETLSGIPSPGSPAPIKAFTK